VQKLCHFRMKKKNPKTALELYNLRTAESPMASSIRFVKLRVGILHALDGNKDFGFAD